MGPQEIDRLIAGLGSTVRRREALDRLLDPLRLEEPAFLAAVLARLPQLVSATEVDDRRLLPFLVDALEAAPEEVAQAAVVAALDAGGPLAEALAGLSRPLPWRKGLGARVLALSETQAARLTLRLYPGRSRLSCAELTAAARLHRSGGLPWLMSQRRAWQRNRGRPVPEGLLPLALAQRGLIRLPANLRLVQVPGLEAGRVSLLRGLMIRSAAEPRAAYRLAARFSAALNTPVITLHNATLGGYSAWGVPGFDLQAKGSGLAREAERFFAAMVPDERLCGELTQRRREALVRPRTRWLLSALRFHARLEGNPSAYERRLARARELLGGTEPPPLAFPFRSRAELEARLEATLALAAAEEARLPEQVRQVGALWLSGRRLMASGRLASLVIPVADKFLASSSRGEGVAYLAAWLRLLRSLAPEARCLLFDASPNPGSPSLRYAPARLSEAGIAALGLGIFSQDGGRPQTLAEIGRHAGTGLFILEPLACRGRRGAERLREGDRTLLSPAGYDPAWKEAAPWLTAGTGLAELADPWLPGPPHHGLVLTSAGPLPGGALYRHLLRRRLGLAEETGRSAEAVLWRRWVGLAWLD